MGDKCDRIGKECVTDFKTCAAFGSKRMDWNVNQFAKWTYWNNQQTTKIQDAPSNKKYNWKPQSEMKLDCDKRDGEGPETITFTSITAGIYQVLVHKHKLDNPQKLKYADARVRFVIPGTEGDVQVVCEMQPNCRKSSNRFWRAAIIELAEVSANKYKFTLHAGEKMWKDYPMDIDALEQKPMFRKVSGKGYWGQYNSSTNIVSDHPIRSDHQKVGKAHFKNTCVSKCTLQEFGAFTRGYDKCVSTK